MRRAARPWRDLGWLAVLAIGLPNLGSSASSRVDLRVKTSPTFFNPSIGQLAEIRVRASAPGTAVVEILDRDRFVVRKLSPTATTSEELIVHWNGRDEAGEVLPDEAYTARVRYVTARGETSYDPGKDFRPKAVQLEKASYSRVDGVLSYRLERPSRVHAQAGQARVVDGRGEGPILRTLVDREPRAGGAVIEPWNGFDESGQVYVPDLPDFAVAVLAVPLPEGTMITVGDREVGFEQYARLHRSQTAVRPRRLDPADHAHHQGLNAFEDRAPSLELQPAANGDNSNWIAKGSQPFSIVARLEEGLAPFFLSQPTQLHVFIDSERVASLACKSSPCRVDLPMARVSKGTHRVVANWASDLGPVSVALHLLERK